MGVFFSYIYPGQQPQPIVCSSCESNGYIECKWCRGTGFFILGNNMLCEVPSRNTTCVICEGKVTKYSIFENLRILLPNITLTNLILFSCRVLFAVLIAKAQASAPSGWENLLHAKNNSLVSTLVICPVKSVCFFLL